MLDFLLVLLYIILTLVFFRFFLPLVWGFYGIFFCFTLVFIPFGLKCFKIALLTLLPYKKEVITNFDSHPILNAFWILTCGLRVAALQCILGVLLHLTIIGIPYGKGLYRTAKMTLIPFGATVVRI